MTNAKRIVALSGSDTAVTLYTDTGETILIRTDEKAIRIVCDEIIPALERGETPYYSEPVSDNPFIQYERKSKLVKFFAIAKTKVKELLHIHEEAQAAELDLSAITNYLQNHATPAESDKEFLSRNFNKDISLSVMEQQSNKEEESVKETATDTVIALVGNTPIVGAEALQKQVMQHNTEGSTEGLDAFLLRLAAKVNKGHTPDDLLRFVQVADLPLAKDGSILAYKVLRTSNENPDIFVDCHTGVITQWVGCVVEMDESLVDPNRTKDCSHGIHIANRRYISGFSGNVCVLCSIAPEDVITVPAYSRYKMRVRKYHILDRLSNEEHNLLKNGKPITDCAAGAARLTKARNLLYPAATTRIELLVPTVRKPEHFKVIYLDEVKAPTEPVPVTLLQATSLDTVTEDKVKPVSVKEMVQVKARSSQFKELFPITTIEAALRAIELKRKYKKSWKALGVSDKEAKKIEKLAKG